MDVGEKLAASQARQQGTSMILYSHTTTLRPGPAWGQTTPEPKEQSGTKSH